MKKEAMNLKREQGEEYGKVWKKEQKGENDVIKLWSQKI